MFDIQHNKSVSHNKISYGKLSSLFAVIQRFKKKKDKKRKIKTHIFDLEMQQNVHNMNHK